MSQFNDQNLGDLLKAVGQGQGKHGSFDKRNRTNKYDNGPPPDPFVVAFGESFGPMAAEVDDIEDDNEDEKDILKREQFLLNHEKHLIVQSNRCDRIYNPSSFDPYDPTTFGYVIFGTAEEAQGIDGDLKIRITSDFANKRMIVGKELFLKSKLKKIPKSYLITSCYLFQKDAKYMGSQEWVITLNGITNRNQATKLNGQEIYVWKMNREELLAKDEYFMDEFIGLPVFRVKDSKLSDSMKQVSHIELNYTNSSEAPIKEAFLFVDKESQNINKKNKNDGDDDNETNTKKDISFESVEFHESKINNTHNNYQNHDTKEAFKQGKDDRS
eukprot:CAMPEP_0114346034 /NCGR_PEP_ID=MMETSP0101-20121206/12745_1 /TAXON_ID=38822 ORGANISM="Pteridomonas danica, Strain PT" /NCGR_SAMPLE_ID=MMETSP0101 /ASSEMBLY_ACC=CAM_ASM_000211 /LENGTH=327 /DNA_ID=CAMNT_0001482437 /DNA_START=139 /DNA_END=1122 /DNA_ORIENTATION=-